MLELEATRTDDEALAAARGRAYFEGLRDGKALARLHIFEELFLAAEAAQEPRQPWLIQWMTAQREQAERDRADVPPTNDSALLAEAAVWRDRLRGRKGWRLLATLIDRLKDLCSERHAQDWLSRACWVCQHTYPALRICSRCGPDCAQCQQARDAARYAFLRQHAQGDSPHMDGTSVWHLSSVAFSQRATTFDAAIDAAMRRPEAEEQP